MKQWLKTNRGLLLFIFCLGFSRTAIADWNPVPSGSMRPTILESDVFTFISPTNGKRLIKRLFALPGDTVEMQDEVLYINNEAAAYSDRTRVAESVGRGIDAYAVRATGDWLPRMERTISPIR